jgi:Uncharacterised nucleotidyltransferase
MSLPSIQLLADALARPSSLVGWGNAQWDLVIRQARGADLLARIASGYQALGLGDQISAQPRMHLESAARLAQRQHREILWEVQQIGDALADIKVDFVLLKGAAYLKRGLGAAAGRTMSDVDILVARDNIAAVETALMMKGWMSEAKSAYDQRYYRTWMHELPPMRHFKRGTVIDVHHAILPTTSRLHPSSYKLMAAATALQPGGRIKVLDPLDMVLHSATHLFHEGELERGFRGLVDIDALLREFSPQNGFWDRLVPRALELDLSRPLFYALRYTGLMLGTPIPATVIEAVANTPGGRRPAPMRVLMDALFLRALRPFHPTCADGFTPLARWLLYLRGHWLRMPPGLLLIHLLRKAVTSDKKVEQA